MKEREGKDDDKWVIKQGTGKEKCKFLDQVKFLILSLNQYKRCFADLVITEDNINTHCVQI